MQDDDDRRARWNRGLNVVEQVYGPGSSALMKGHEDSDFVAETVAHLFGDIWSRSALSIREKRLLVIGATAMLGRSDLLAIQFAGAIANAELTDAQLEEIALLMMFYCGAGNGTALYQAIQQGKARAAQMGLDPSSADRR